MTRPLFLLAAAATVLTPVMATAQVKEALAASRPSAPAPAPAPRSNDTTGTQLLNRQQADAARAQQDANIASQQNYQARIEEFEAATAAAAAARAAYEAEIAINRQARDAYDAAYARWQADVAACTAGDYSRCQTTAPAPK